MTSKSVLKREAVQKGLPMPDLTTKPVSHDVEREKFEALFNERFQDLGVSGIASHEFTKAKSNMWYGYQMATAQQAETIASLQKELESYRTMQRTDNSGVIASMQSTINAYKALKMPNEDVLLDLYKIHAYIPFDADNNP